MIADFLAVQRIAAAAAILSVAHCTLQAGTNVEHSLQRRGDGQGEVKALDLSGVTHLGVTSGASTPEGFLNAAVAWLRG